MDEQKLAQLEQLSQKMDNATSRLENAESNVAQYLEDIKRLQAEFNSLIRN